MLLGVAHPGLCEPLAQVLQSLGVRRAMVVCGRISPPGAPVIFVDELSTLGENKIAEFYQERGFAVSTTWPEDLGGAGGDVGGFTRGRQISKTRRLCAGLCGARSAERSGKPCC